jgi:ketosteroid isomerase-like protein
MTYCLRLASSPRRSAHQRNRLRAWSDQKALRRRGLEAVVKRSQLIVSYGLTFTLKHVLYSEHGVALSLNNTARRGNLTLDEHLATVCQLRDGKIFTITTYLSDVDMVNAFFV